MDLFDPDYSAMCRAEGYRSVPRTQRETVLVNLQTFGPLTAQEIASRTGLKLASVNARLNELLVPPAQVRKNGLKLNPATKVHNCLWEST